MLKEKLAKVGETLDKTFEKTEHNIKDFIKAVEETISDATSKTVINGIEICVDEDKNVIIKGNLTSLTLNNKLFYQKVKEDEF